MAVSFNAAEQGPMAEMNTTPLIDVMLVLLIMFIITIPVATHSFDVDLPQGPPPPLSPDSVKNKIVINAQDGILWNGDNVTAPQMTTLLIETTKMPIEPELQFEPDAHASYAASAKVLKTIKAVGVTKFGFVGNEKYRNFDKPI